MWDEAKIFDERAIVQEALDNFAVLIDDLDFSAEMELLGIGRFQFLLRKLMRTELTGLYMALWRQALARSFPAFAPEMFHNFLDRYVDDHPGKIGMAIMERALLYWKMIQPAGDSDFSNIANHLTSFVVKENRDTRALNLKLALHIRKTYRFIFERLI